MGAKCSLYKDVLTIYAASIYWISYPVLVHKEVMLRHWEHFKLNIFIFVSSWVLSPHHTWYCKSTHYFSATHDDKINDCGFKFSMACEWLISNRRRQGCNLSEFSPLNSQFAKVLPRHHFALYSIYCLHSNFQTTLFIQKFWKQNIFLK